MARRICSAGESSSLEEGVGPFVATVELADVVLVFTLLRIEFSAFCTAAELVCLRDTTRVVSGESPTA